MVADLRWLQQISVNGGASPGYVLNFRNATPYGYNITVSTQVIKAVTFPKTLQLYGAPKPIIFSGSGAPNGGQSVTLGSTRTGKLKYVVIAGATGRVRISDISVIE
jgi:hypothetical protein